MTFVIWHLSGAASASASVVVAPHFTLPAPPPAATAGGGGAYASAFTIAAPATLQAPFPAYVQYPPADGDGAGSGVQFAQDDLKALKELLFWAQNIVDARIANADNDAALNKRLNDLTNRYRYHSYIHKNKINTFIAICSLSVG